MLEKDRLYKEADNAINWIKEYVEKAGAKGVVIGNFQADPDEYEKIKKQMNMLYLLDSSSPQFIVISPNIWDFTFNMLFTGAI